MYFKVATSLEKLMDLMKSLDHKFSGYTFVRGFQNIYGIGT